MLSDKNTESIVLLALWGAVGIGACIKSYFLYRKQQAEEEDKKLHTPVVAQRGPYKVDVEPGKSMCNINNNN